MALLKELKHPSGVIVDNAYWKVAAVVGGKDYLTIRLEAYLNESAAHDTFEDGKLIARKKDPLLIQNRAFRPSVEEGAENFIKQAYEYLKTLPEFEGATDC